MDFTDKDSLYRAMLARDKRFDGRFYIGVRTTGIYCRPVCPARPKKENVTFYRSQAEAENAGFRPCLRCRPDFTPGSQMWEGTAALVGRTLRMLSLSEGEPTSLSELAAKLGVTDRHLRRLFDQHLGASPIEVVLSQRLHLAKHLLSQTYLPITEVALASGFQSVRRFNEAFRIRYKRTPTEMRKEGAIQSSRNEGLRLFLPVLEPYDWNTLYQFLQSHAVLGIEAVSNNRYQRVLFQNKNLVRIGVEYDSEKSHLIVDIDNADPSSLRSILVRIRNLFDADHNPFNLCDSRGTGNLDGIRVPGAFDPFETAISIILGQLVSTEQARLKMKNLVELSGLTHTFPSPQSLSQMDLSQLKLTRVKAHAIRELARRYQAGDICLDRTASLPETREKLLSVKGIGPWTVEMIAMRCLGDSNAFPKNDLIIQRAIDQLKIEPQGWEPWRSYLTLWIWKNYASKLSKIRKKK